MSDLISRDALIRDISEKIDISKAERAAAIKRGRYDDAYFYSGEVCIARRIRRYVSMFAPTVDAEPVVRCRDCKYWSGRNDKPGEVTAIGYCDHPNHHIMPLRAGWHCADGTKMDAKEDDNV